MRGGVGFDIGGNKGDILLFPDYRSVDATLAFISDKAECPLCFHPKPFYNVACYKRKV